MTPMQRGQLEIHPELNEIAGPARRQRLGPRVALVPGTEATVTQGNGAEVLVDSDFRLCESKHSGGITW